MKTAASVLDLVGGTPLVKLGDACRGLAEVVYGKLERLNPIGSVKDRIARAMVEDAEERGTLSPGGTIVEPTSGNTGVALAMIGAAKGYRVILTMPDSMSIERRRLLVALGARLVLTPGADGMRGAIEEADRLARRTSGAVILGQFDNPANPRTHERTTAPEIWDATEGRVDVVVAGIGTGGTATGVARFLRERRPSARVIGVEPASSPFLTEGRSGPHKIQGIGAGFAPAVLEADLLGEIVRVSDEEAARWMRHLARHEGILCGISSGAALAATKKVAERRDAQGAVIVAILPDGGEKYLSSSAWEEGDDDDRPNA
jgi:cysteine synthase A